MTENKIIAKIDFEAERIVKNNKYIKNIIEALISNDLTSFFESANKKKVGEYLLSNDISLQQFIDKYKTDKYVLNLFARLVKKESSRQGAENEVRQLKTCHTIASKFGINIVKLSNRAFRAIKRKGRIVSEKEMKIENIDKNSCYKSFDAKITGVVTGWVFAKIVYNNGGHQDNQLEEINALCDWVSEFMSESEELFVFLVDTNREEKIQAIKAKYKQDPNIFIGGHAEFQQYIIDNYILLKT